MIAALSAAAGPIAIRPLEIKQLFDFGIRLYRFNFIPMFLSMTIVQLPSSLLSLPIILALISAGNKYQEVSMTGESMETAFLDDLGTKGPVVLAALVAWAAYQLLAMPLGNLTCCRLAERAMFGQRISFAEAFEFAKRRYWPTQVALATYWLPVVLLSLLILLPVYAFQLAGNSTGVLSSSLIGIFLIMTGLMVTLLFYYRLFPALMGAVQVTEEPEGEGIIAQGVNYLRRSFSLTAGYYGRCLGLTFIVYFVVNFISQGLADTVNLIHMVIQALMQKGDFGEQFLSMATSSETNVNPVPFIIVMVVSLLFPPFLQCYKTLMYFDLRCRKEAFDLKVVLGTAEEPAE